MLKRLAALLAALFIVLPAYGADVSAACKDWSATSNSNNPSGSTTIGSGLDDNLREIQGSVIRCLNYKGADIASATTTDLGAVEGLAHNITGTTTITGFGTVRAGVWKAVVFSGALTLTHNATSLILPGAANITTAAGDIAIAMSEGSGNWRVWSYVKASGYAVKGGVYRSVQVFTGSGTYTAPTGLSFAKVTAVGGGGAGGGSPATGGAQVSGGASGAYGGIAIRTLTAAQIGASQTVTIAAAATGNSGAAGSNGGTTTFGALLTASGGTGGPVAGPASAVTPGGLSGGTGTSGDVNIPGAPGNMTMATNAGSFYIVATGASGPYGAGGIGPQVGTVGGAATGYGAGGSGTVQGASGAAVTGGAATAGIVIVEEFF